MKRSILLSLLTSWLLLGAYNVSGQIKIASGLDGEIYNQFAIDIKNNTDVPVEVFSTAGSQENLHLLSEEGFQLGFIQYDVLLFNELKKKDIKKNIKVMLPLYDEEVHLITRNDGSINQLIDLQDKRVGIGSKQSGTAITAQFIQYKTMMQWEAIELAFDASFAALLNDSIDAFFFVGAAPSNTLKALSKNVQQLIKLVPIENESLNDFYLNKTIKKEVYPWLKEDIATISVKSLIAVNTKNINDSTAQIVDVLYDDLKGNLKGIQKNKLSHPKWDDVDFSSMRGIDWPVYRERYVSMDFWSLMIAYLAALLSFIQIYFIINKLWKRKHERVVSESISISAMFISILINVSFAFKNINDGGFPQLSANILWIIASIISAAIGMGLWVASNRDVGFFTLLYRALNLERKEAGDLAKVFFKPSGADKILEILGRMAMVDEDLDKREKEFIQSFADHWHIDVDWDEIQKYVHEAGDRFDKIKNAMDEYLKTSPQEEQVNQLRDVFNLLVNIDEVVTEEEQMIMDELEGKIAEYLNKEEGLEVFKVAVVPQSQEQDEAVKQLLKDLSREKIAGGYAYLSQSYYSERYAEMISAQYRAIQVFSVVVKPKQLMDEDFVKGMLNQE
jgi:TRAP transporter TAXI family solute receptor